MNINSTLTDMEEPPTLVELMGLGDKNFDIIEEIGGSYRKFGVKILEDTGAKMDAIEKELRGDVEMINNRVLTRWIRGEGRTPTTWATLADVLDECKLTNISKKIRSAKGTKGKYIIP